MTEGFDTFDGISRKHVIPPYDEYRRPYCRRTCTRKKSPKATVISHCNNEKRRFVKAIPIKAQNGIDRRSNVDVGSRSFSFDLLIRLFGFNEHGSRSRWKQRQ